MKIINVNESFKKNIAKILYYAVGDKIKEDISHAKIKAFNSKHTRIWDFIIEDVQQNFACTQFITNPVKRGNWTIIPIVDKETGILYSLMKESRFNDLQKKLQMRKNVHYADIFIKSFNSDLLAIQEQLTFSFNESKVFDNEDCIRKMLQKMLLNLNISEDLIEKYALILFDYKNYQLNSLRCVVINSNFLICEEHNWSDYININESIIVENIDENNEVSNNPPIDIILKPKALGKLNQATLVREKENDEESEYLKMNKECT